MNSKNYQTTSLEHFIILFEKNPLEFPLNILEIKPTQYYKKITKATQKQGWVNASKNTKLNWFLRLFHKTNIGSDWEKVYNNFLLLREKESKIILNLGGAGITANLFMDKLINDFIPKGNHCMIIINRYIVPIEYCFNSLWGDVKNADENLKVWYLD